MKVTYNYIFFTNRRSIDKTNLLSSNLEQVFTSQTQVFESLSRPHKFSQMFFCMVCASNSRTTPFLLGRSYKTLLLGYVNNYHKNWNASILKNWNYVTITGFICKQNSLVLYKDFTLMTP